MTSNNLCPCGSGQTFEHCCGPYLSGARLPPTAEALMRSRYSAYHRGNAAYLQDTCRPRPPTLTLDADLRWIGLKIVTTSEGRENDDSGMVYFKARYKVNGKGGRLEEHSRFRKIDGRWFYMAAEVA